MAVSAPRSFYMENNAIDEDKEGGSREKKRIKCLWRVE
jgi:hypothetical protein